MLSRFLRRYRAGLLLSFIFSGANAAITLIVLSRINFLITHGLRHQNLRALQFGILCLAALLVVGVASQLVITKVGGELVGGMRSELSSQFIGLEFERLAERKHTVFGSLIEDVARIVNFVSLIPQLVYQSFMMLLYLAYLAVISRPLFAALIPAMLLTVAVATIFSKLAAARFDALRTTEEPVFECFRAITEGKKEMSLNAQRAAHFTKHVLTPAIGRAQESMITAHRCIGVNSAVSISISYATILILAYLGYAEFSLPIQRVTEFVLVALFLAGPIGFLTHALQQVSMGMASLRHLSTLGLDHRSRIDGHSLDHADLLTGSQWKVIHACNLSYRYPPQGGEAGYRLGPIDLRIRNGETIFITGGNGSGKSTLLLLLCGLLRPAGGSMLLDGRPVTAEMSAYRGRFSGVFGDFFLFADVIDKWGRNVSDNRIGELLDRIKLKTKVEVRDGKLSKLCLSTGQRKRLALLQCYAEDKDICFFDEWAADQDVQFREYFYSALIPEWKRNGKTLLVISHDERYFGVADRVIKLEHGRIISDTDGSSSCDVSRASIGV